MWPLTAENFWILLLIFYCRLQQISSFLFQEEPQDDQENMQEMDILDMNILDETENDNGIPAEDDEDDAANIHTDEDALLNEEHDKDEDALLDEEHDNKTCESEDEARAPEVRK